MAAYAYRFFDHTADVGVEAEADSREELFAAVAEAVVHLLLERPPRPGDAGDPDGSAAKERVFEATAPDLETLLVRWVNEILYWVQVEEWVPARTAVTLRSSAGRDVPGEDTRQERTPQRQAEEGALPGDVPKGVPEGDPDRGWRLAATCAGVPLDVRVMGFRGEIKAATYHQLAVRPVAAPAPGRWQARIILDV
ncbi:MAG TPA: archease [Thermaerobacter sp.]